MPIPRQRTYGLFIRHPIGMQYPLGQSTVHGRIDPARCFIWAGPLTERPGQEERLRTFLRDLKGPRGPVAIIMDVYSFPSEYPDDVVTTLLAHDFISVAYIKNLEDSFVHKKTRFMPLGIDFHTLSRPGVSEPAGWGHGHPPASVDEQVSALNGVLQGAPPDFSSRRCTVAITFALRTSGERTSVRTRSGSDRHRPPVPFITREDCARYVTAGPHKTLWTMANSGQRLEAWRAMAACAFVLSPLGMGFDCHRTWEALCLGAIPIVPVSPIAKHLVDMGLPVMVITDLREINQANLRRWQAYHGQWLTSPSRAAAEDRLTSSYWTRLLEPEAVVK